MLFENSTLLEEKTPEDVAKRVAKEFILFVTEELDSKDSLSVAFSGGSTPSLLFSELGSIFNRKKIPWEKIHIFQVDERWVPKTHKDNNFRTLKRLLLDKLNIPEENIHPMPVTEDKEETCRKNYEFEIKLILDNDDPVFDLVLLGMGNDGHTASIFPGESGKIPIESANFVEVPFVEKLDSLRMTLTGRVLLTSLNVWFLVTGSAKKEILQKVFTSEYNPELYPSQLLSKAKGKIKFFGDEQAFELIKKKREIK